MQLGLHFWNYSMPGQPATLPSVLADTARAAEEVGFTQFSVMDHYFQMEAAAPRTEPMLEAYTTLGYLAGVTSSIRLGTVVTGITYRHPGLLAKILTTLDVLSSGRAFAGLGAAWYEREHLALGVPYPPISERFEKLEETLRIALQMWSEEDAPFAGAHYTLAETLNSPSAIQRPHPPIMIGGKGEKKTLRLAAQYAQIVNLTSSDPDEVGHLLEVLRGHCDAVGTDYDAIEKQVIASGADPFGDGFVERVEALAAHGIELVVLGALPPDPVGFVHRVSDELMPKLA
jgi:F420-dependent oxidoreductase-like protein